MRRALAALLVAAAAACAPSDQAPPATDQRLTELHSGYDFLTPETQALQDDQFANPGFLWVDRGRSLFAESVGAAPACASCHNDAQRPLVGAAASYPKIDETSSELINLEGRINLCRARYQHAAPLPYESDDLLALTAYVANLSAGRKASVSVTEANAGDYERGRAYFNTRRGQFNLSCAQCHDRNWGRKLRGDTISQGQSNGFPAYRLEWQSLGSLHRRFHDCDVGVRAEPHAPGSQTYIALELYLAVRGAGLERESPAVRR